MGKIILTQKGQAILLFLTDDSGHPQMIRGFALSDKNSPADKARDIPGNIYIGRVEEIVKGLDAAFVSIAPGEKVFLPLSQCESPLLSNREYDGRIKTGDGIVIQITTRALKTKLPAATARLSLPGSYCVCHMDDHRISCSAKLPQQEARALKEAIRERDLEGRKNYGFTVRTNAGSLPDKEPLFQEMAEFIRIFDDLKQKYKTRVCHTCLYRSEPELMSVIRGVPLTDYDEIVTDIEWVRDILAPFTAVPIRFYQDTLVSLGTLYSLETHLGRALEKRVWLPCGGYLVIEPTEAMVVIDVNSGKASADKSIVRKNLHLQINLEAAREIARQLRLRNLSGMIMVDFINMDSKEDNRILLEKLGQYLRADKVETRLVDMTALGIVEITRKKISKPLSDFIRKC